MIGTDGTVLDGQSFFSRSTLDPGLLKPFRFLTVLLAGPFDYTLPVQVLDVLFRSLMQNAYLSGSIRSDSSIHGYFGGSVSYR